MPRFIPKNIKAILNNAKGFTAAEIAAALFFLCLVLGVIIILAISANYMQAKSRFYDAAPLLAQAKLAETETNPRKLINTAGTFGSGFPGYSWSVSFAPQEVPIFIFADREFKKVMIEIDLNEEYVYQLEKYIFVYR